MVLYLKDEKNKFIDEQEVARWFASSHKDFFGNGPQGVTVTSIDNYFVISANQVLNKYEKSLRNIPEGPERIKLTRNLLFKEIKEKCKLGFQDYFNLSVEDIRYSVNVQMDRSLCTIVCKLK